MAKLYYGNGDVTIEGSEIRGVQLKYQGSIKVEKTCGDNFVLMHQNKGVLIFPLGDGYLNDLFIYSGNLKITSVAVTNNNGESVPCTIKKVMDYSELLNSTAETMTTKAEDLKAGHTHTREIKETPQVLENLHTKDRSTPFYLSDDSVYEGAYHIHFGDTSAMTGGVHDENSQDLYIKQAFKGKIVDKLVPTRNLNSTRKRRRR